MYLENEWNGELPPELWKDWKYNFYTDTKWVGDENRETGFTKETNRKMAENIAAIQQQWKDITETQDQISELEEWNLDAKEAIVTLLSEV